MEKNQLQIDGFQGQSIFRDSKTLRKNHLESRPNLAFQKEKNMTSSWHHHFFPTQTRKESAPPMFWMLVCYHFFLLKQNASFFRPSCADDLEYQSHVTGRKKFYGSWANKSLHLWMGCFVYLLGVLRRFYLECHLKDYDVFLSSCFYLFCTMVVRGGTSKSWVVVFMLCWHWLGCWRRTSSRVLGWLSVFFQLNIFGVVYLLIINIA